MVTTLVARRAQLHQARLVEYARPDNPNFQNQANGLAQHFAHSGLGAHEAYSRAVATIYQGVQAQATTLAYIDIFMVLCVVSGIMFFLAFLLKKNDPGGGRVLAE